MTKDRKQYFSDFIELRQVLTKAEHEATVGLYETCYDTLDTLITRSSKLMDEIDEDHFMGDM